MGFTKEQLEAIKSLDKDTIVSASAGSGKTTLMIGKIDYLLSNRQFLRENGGIANIAVVTYTNAVARELKNKISKMLIDKLKKNNSEYLREQLENLPLANISTIHGMCTRFIKEYFSQLELDPNLIVLDSPAAKILRREVIEEILENENKKGAEEYIFLQRLLKKSFIDTLQDILEKLDYVVDSEQYIKDVILLAYSLNKQKELKETILKENKFIFEYYLKQIEELRKNTTAQITLYDLDDVQTIIKNVIKIDDVDKISQEHLAIPKKPALKKQDKTEENILIDEEWKQIRKNIIKELGYIKNSLFAANVDEKDKEKLVYLIDIVKRVQETYKSKKLEINAIDFADQEHLALKLLSNEQIAEEIRNKFDYVFVDEYQDANVVQEEILKIITKDKQNLFMVGDPKQSIYGFRYAEPKIFISKVEKFTNDEELGKTVPLNNNFRSRKEILDFVNKIFNVIMTKESCSIDYKNTSKLEPPDDSPYISDEHEEYVKVVHFIKEDKNKEEKELNCENVYSVINDKKDVDNTCEEGQYIANMIKKHLGEIIYDLDLRAFRPSEYSDFAILTQDRHADVDAIIDVLRENGIPVDAAPILKKQEDSSLQKLIAFLEIINNSKQDIPLTTVMLSMFGDFNMEDLIAIKKQNSAMPFYEAVEKYNKDDNTKEKIDKFMALVNKYRFESQSLSVNELLNKILVETNFDTYVLSLDGGERTLEKIRTYISSVSSQSYNSSLSKFLYTRKHNPKKDTLDEININEEKCVKTSTIHASKGLQYQYVFLVNTNKEFIVDKTKTIKSTKEYGIGTKHYNEEYDEMVDSVVNKAFNFILEKEAVAENMRLLYVALTRAQHRLFVTATGKTELFASTPFIQDVNCLMRYIDLVATEDKNFYDKYYDRVVIEEEEQKDIVQQEVQTDVDEELVADIKKLFNNNYIHEQATKESIVRTVTEINKLTKEEDFVVKSMFLDTTTPEKGTAYHRVLECIDFSLNTKKDVQYAMEEMLLEGLITKNQFENVDPAIICDCLNSEIMTLAREGECEREKQFSMYVPACDVIENAIQDKILIRGTIDLLIKHNNEYIILDYKYSHASEQEIKERYTKQLELYAMALERCLGIKIKRKVLYVLGSNTLIEC